MRKMLLFASFIGMSLMGFAQSFPGYNSGNYIGVNSVFTNPANIADSRYRWDINLVGVHAEVGNNNASFSLKNLDDAFGGDVDSVFLGSSAKNTNAIVNVDIYGPSFMFNVGKKASIALTSRVRTLANLKDIDGQLIKSIDDNLDATLPLNMSSNANQKIVVNSWKDIGLSFAHVLYSNEHHFFKGGITAKYLAGVANTHVNIANFSGTANDDGGADDTYITNAQGGVSVGISGIDVDDLKVEDLLKFKSVGFGADVGFVYEYRPYGDAVSKEHPNKYKYKVAISLMDMGSIKYTPDPTKTGAYNINIPTGSKWYPGDLKDSSVSGIKNYLDANPGGYFNPQGSSTASYKASLPTNLLVSVDYNVFRKFFVGLSTQLNAAKKENKYVSYYNNSVTLTPRYEGKAFGVYIPLNYNELTNFNAGLSLRLGPVFLGSGSIITALTSKSKQADFHFGVRFGSLKKNEKTTVANKVKKHKAVNNGPVVPQIIDTDGDGINDSMDSCKTVAGTAKYNGCPVPDTDGDGVNDDMDSCKTIAGVAKYNGCPIPDTDADGINDEEDKCINVAGLARYAGCPIPDTDADGINDEEDQCNTVAGTAKYKGCPIPDTDGDGVNDDDDKCPGLAGDKDNFGCPQLKKGVKKADPAVKKDLVTKINTAAKGLQFSTGKAVILAKSYPALNNVVKILKADPALNLSIEGYTDSVGNADKNLQLSKARADAAKAYLVKKGIAESRISADGFGAENPIASNKTAAGRLKNRRVVFTLSK